MTPPLVPPVGQDYTESMRPDELQQIGTALYGPEWQTPLAAALGFSARTVRRWVAGDTSMTVPTERIAVLCRRRADEILRDAERRATRLRTLSARLQG